MKIFLLVSGFCAFCLFTTSCQKKSDPTQDTTSKTDLISASAWTYQDAGLDVNRDGAVDANSSFSTIAPTLVPTCRTDNSIAFKKDNTGTVDEGATKCNATDAQSSSFNWSFADNETAINVSNNIFALLNGKSKVYALTAAQVTLTRDTVLGGTTYPVVVILKH